MTLEQALQILDQATAQLSLPRIGHQQLLEALRVLREALKDKAAD